MRDKAALVASGSRILPDWKRCAQRLAAMSRLERMKKVARTLRAIKNCC